MQSSSRVSGGLARKDRCRRGKGFGFAVPCEGLGRREGQNTRAAWQELEVGRGGVADGEKGERGQCGGGRAMQVLSCLPEPRSFPLSALQRFCEKWRWPGAGQKWWTLGMRHRCDTIAL